MSAAIAILTVAPVACGVNSSARPVTTHEVPTTTLPGRPSISGGPENPMRVGEPMSVGGWNISVVESRIGARDGSGEAVVTYDVGVIALSGNNGTTSLASDVTLWALGASRQVYAPVEDCADGVMVKQAVAPADVLEGFVCFVVAAGDAEGLLLIVEAIASPVPHRVFLATAPTAVADK